MRARFGELRRGGYESYYLRAVRPEGGLGVWIRYTVHRRPGAEPAGSLWFTLFDADAPAPVAAKITMPGVATGGDWLRVAGGRIGEGVAVGEIHLPDGPRVAWTLAFQGEDAFAHLPRPWLYRAPLPRTKPVSLHPVARFGGVLTVGDRRVELDGWPGMVGHNWGARHAERWIWLHAMGFRERDGWLDVVLARIEVAGRLTPWLASGAICLGSQRFRLGGPARPAVGEAPDRLAFSLPGRALTARGTVHAPRERFVGWIYANPDGSEHHAVNCSIADLELTVSAPDGDPVVLTAPGLAAYELGMREHDHGMIIQPFTDG